MRPVLSDDDTFRVMSSGDLLEMKRCDVCATLVDRTDCECALSRRYAAITLFATWKAYILL